MARAVGGQVPPSTYGKGFYMKNSEDSNCSNSRTSPIFIVLLIIASVLIVFFVGIIFYLCSPYRECDHYSNTLYAACIRNVKEYGCYLNCQDVRSSNQNNSYAVSRGRIIESMRSENYSYDSINKVLYSKKYHLLSSQERKNIEKGLSYNSPPLISDILDYTDFIKKFMLDASFRFSLSDYYQQVGVNKFFKDITTQKYIKIGSNIQNIYLYSEVTKHWKQLNYNIKLRGYHRVFGETIPEGSGGYSYIVDLENYANHTDFGSFKYFILQDNLYAQNNFTYELYIVTFDINGKVKIVKLKDEQIKALFPNTNIIRISQFKNHNYTIFWDDKVTNYFLIDDLEHYKYSLDLSNILLLNNNVNNLFKPNYISTIYYGPWGHCSFESKDCYYINVRY